MSVIKFPPQIAFIFGIILLVIVILMFIILILSYKRFMKKLFNKIVFLFLILTNTFNLGYIVICIIIPASKGYPV